MEMLIFKTIHALAQIWEVAVSKNAGPSVSLLPLLQPWSTSPGTPAQSRMAVCWTAQRKLFTKAPPIATVVPPLPSQIKKQQHWYKEKYLLNAVIFSTRIVLEREATTMHWSLQANDSFPKTALESPPGALSTPASGLQMLSHLLNRANNPQPRLCLQVISAAKLQMCLLKHTL